MNGKRDFITGALCEEQGNTDEAIKYYKQSAAKGFSLSKSALKYLGVEEYVDHDYRNDIHRGDPGFRMEFLTINNPSVIRCDDTLMDDYEKYLLEKEYKTSTARDYKGRVKRVAKNVNKPVHLLVFYLPVIIAFYESYKETGSSYMRTDINAVKRFLEFYEEMN